MLTAQNVISRADDYKPNDYGTAEKLEALASLDRRIISEIINARGGSCAPAAAIEDGADLPLIAASRPDLYFYRLLCAIDLHNGDLTRYNNDRALFNEEYESFRNEYNRTHPAGNVKLRY